MQRSSAATAGVVFSTLLTFFVSTASATVYVKTRNIPDPQNVGGFFGLAVAALGSNVLVSAPFNTSQAVAGAGQVYLYNPDTGALITTFDNPQPDFPDAFGMALVTLAGDVIVGAPYDAGTRGTVYRMNATTGALLQTYVPPDSGGSFGWNLALRGTDLVIGARTADPSQAGKVYVLDSTTGSAILTLSNPNAGTYDFGRAVGVIGNDILVGGHGVVHQFDGTTGAIVRVYTQPPGNTGSFGWQAITTSGNEILIGSIGGNNPTAAGFLFDGTTGNLIATYAGDGSSGRTAVHLGAKVALAAEGGPIKVYTTGTGAVDQTLSGPAFALAAAPGHLYAGATGLDIYTVQSCLVMECNPNTDTCCNPNTCKFDKCDPNVDQCCSASTCDFVQCNPEASPCCDANTCNWKATNAVCVQSTGSNAGCKTGQCNASHVCQNTGATNLPNATVCVSQVNPCFAGECNNGVCQPPEGVGQPWGDRCTDQNACTDDADACKKNEVTGAFVRCAFKDPDVFVTNGTSCSTTSGTICTVKECTNGVCNPLDPPVTKDCSALPAVQTCHLNSCKIVSGQPQCVADQLAPAGTVCESTVPSDDWDCKHYRCGTRGRCRANRATEGKVCDYQPATTPTMHCRLGTCGATPSCNSPLYSTLSVVEDMETAALDTNGQPVLADLATCPSDGNVCTVDRCNGSTDACINPCNTGVVCSVPGVCNGSCQLSGSNCSCVGN